MRLRFGEYVLDMGTREVTRGAEAVALSPKSFQLLELLIGRRPNAVSKEELHQVLWPNTFVSDTNLANLVNELRTALGDDARHSRLIRTVPRFGYAFKAPTESLAEENAAAAPGLAYRLQWGEREIALSDGENVIGRDQDSVVWVNDVSVSRHHARVVIDGAGARVEDLGSKNGTYVGSRRVKKTSPLGDGDELRLGTVVLVFRIFDRGVSTATASRQ